MKRICWREDGQRKSSWRVQNSCCTHCFEQRRNLMQCKLFQCQVDQSAGQTSCWSIHWDCRWKDPKECERSEHSFSSCLVMFATVSGGFPCWMSLENFSGRGSFLRARRASGTTFCLSIFPFLHAPSVAFISPPTRAQQHQQQTTKNQNSSTMVLLFGSASQNKSDALLQTSPPVVACSAKGYLSHLKPQSSIVRPCCELEWNRSGFKTTIVFWMALCCCRLPR